MKTARTQVEETERMRNLLAFLLVGAFIAVIPAAMLFVIPEKNKDLVTYMVGQLSGMALMALGFYFVNKVGQDAQDAKRVDNTGKMADAMKETAIAAGAATAVTAAAAAAAGITVEPVPPVKPDITVPPGGEVVIAAEEQEPLP